jgi:hypothetical protein
MSNLVWNPAIEKINELVTDGNSINGCISAFATADAVEVLAKSFCPEHCFFITRWRVPELATGVSDIEVYPLLRDLNIPLYISFKLHSKLYRFTNGNALCGSCNATGNGLGLNEDSNIETACVVPSLDIEDEIELKGLGDASLRVTDDIYAEFKNAVDACPPAPPYCTDELEIYQRYMRSKKFLLSDLPATKNPELLLSTILRSRGESKIVPSAMADCVNFRISPGSTNNIEDELASNFCNSSFVKSIVAEIRSKESMSFGAVTTFVHDRCRDVPLPYRSDVKERVNTLYNWLCYFFEDLSWDVPGARSQVIRSNRRT